MTDDLRTGGIAILDFGSQYTQLIARRVRELGVYAEVFAHDAAVEQLNVHKPVGYILSGGPMSIYEEGAFRLHQSVLDAGLPVLGICYGMHLLSNLLGGEVVAGETREYGPGHVIQQGENRLFDGLSETLAVWMSHGDHVEAPPEGFDVLAKSDNGLLAAIGNDERQIYCVQFHPEVSHTPQGIDLLRNFVFGICSSKAKWSPDAFVMDAIKRIQAQVGNERVLLGLSGGVDSAVAGALIHKAIGDKLTCIFVNTGMLRKDEPEQVVKVFDEEQGMT